MISVIVPVYNAEKYLKKAIDSVLSQTLARIELVCINDGSKDGSMRILSEYQKNYSNINQDFLHLSLTFSFPLYAFVSFFATTPERVLIATTSTSKITAVAYAWFIYSPSLDSIYIWIASVRPEPSTFFGTCATVPAV